MVVWLLARSGVGVVVVVVGEGCWGEGLEERLAGASSSSSEPEDQPGSSSALVGTDAGGGC